MVDADWTGHDFLKCQRDITLITALSIFFFAFGALRVVLAPPDTTTRLLRVLSLSDGIFVYRCLPFLNDPKVVPSPRSSPIPSG